MENLNNQAPTQGLAVQSDVLEPTPIDSASLAGKPLGMPGVALDPGLASRLNQSNKPVRRLNIKLVIIIVAISLLLGASAYAWFFTDLKYKLPWFKVTEDKLVGLMYERLAQLDGADFALTYKLNVGERDKDVKVDEKKVSDSEAKMRVSALKSAYSYSYKYNIDACYSRGLNLQASAGKNCDGSANAKPKVGESFCTQSLNNVSGNPIVNFNPDAFSGLPGQSSGKWADLADYEWEYDGACTSDLANKTYSFSMHSTYNDDKITCNEKDCVWNNEGLMDIGGDSSMNLDLLFGTYLEEIDNYISTNFNLEATLSGSGFSLKERESDKQQLPNVGVGFAGKADLGSMSGSIKMEAKVIDDAIYFKVDAFPVTDITQGHEGEWIKVDSEDNSWTNEMIPEFSKDQNQAIVDFRNFVAKTKDYNVLTFKATGDYLEKDGIKAPIFEVNLVPENVPNWLQDLRNIYSKNQAIDSGATIKTNQYTEAEKTKIIAKVKEAMANMKNKVALNPNTGDLMNLTVDFRIIPPASSKKFATKQFNSSLSVDLWNHNKPTTPKVPDKFIEQSEIEREALGYSQEAYQDIKQAKRITRIRQDLLKYYNEHQTWPQKLSEASKSIIDFNTGKEYPYQVLGSNYIITYQMGGVEQKANPKDKGNYYNYISDGLNGFGQNTLTYTKENWDKGENKADRYSPVAHKYVSSRQWLVDDVKHYDSDVLQNLEQARIIRNLSNKISSFYNKNKRYPDSLAELSDLQTYYNTYSTKKTYYYACEDLSLAKPCEYQKKDDAYIIKVNYSLSLDNIDKSLIASNKYNLVSWQAGLYEYNALTIKQDLGSTATYNQYTDTDMDGLLDADEARYGTDKYNKDTDGDGFADGEEVKNGYNPNGSGELPPLLPKGVTSSIKYNQISASDWVKGDSKALVAIIVYSDADCPYCAKFHETINQVLKDYKGKVKVAYRHFPLTPLHPEAARKAEAIECVGELGGNDKVWAFLDKLFVTAKPTLTQLGDTVSTLGIDKVKFQTCLASGKYASKVTTQSAAAQTAGAQGTPYSLLVKGTSVQAINGAFPYENLKTMIDNLLK